MNKDQAQKINQVIKDWVEENGGDETGNIDRFTVIQKQKSLITQINRTLKKMSLSTIDENSPDLKLDVSSLDGFAGSQFQGVQITDGKSKFCFPCTPEHNLLKWGIVPFVKGPRNPRGDFHQSLKCLETLDDTGYFSRNNINTQNYTGTRFIPIMGRESGRDGFYVVTDESIYFYPVQLPKKILPSQEYEKNYKITLPNGQKTAVSIINNGEANFFASEYTKHSPDAIQGDLGTGAGDKINNNSRAAIRDEIFRQFEKVALLEKTDQYVNTFRLYNVACKALNECQADKNTYSREIEEKFNQYRTKFKCNSSPTSSQGENSSSNNSKSAE